MIEDLSMEEVYFVHRCFQLFYPKELIRLFTSDRDLYMQDQNHAIKPVFHSFAYTTCL